MSEPVAPESSRQDHRGAVAGLLFGALLLPACTPPEPEPELFGVGADVDERDVRELASSYAPPAVFYDTLEALGVEPDQLNYPDAGADFDVIPTRLAWTDQIRHQGDLAPVFAHMVGEDVEAAVAAADPLVELLVAQHVYNGRHDYAVSRYDLRVEVDPEAEPLVSALRALIEHPGVTDHADPPDVSWAELEAVVREQVATLPEEARVPLAVTLPALVRAAELRDAALLSSGALEMADWEALHTRFWDGLEGRETYSHAYGTEAHAGFDFEAMARAAQVTARATESLRRALADVPLRAGAVLDVPTPLGRVTVSLEDVASTWNGADDEWLLLLDGGGDDVWLGPVATNKSLWLPISVALDLRGDDLWSLEQTAWTVDDEVPDGPWENPSWSWWSTRMQGLGLFGVALLDDAGGDDEYVCGGLGQGAGVWGVGVLLDHGGSDSYRGYVDAQGHGQFGQGLLVDLGAGDDSYETLEKSQGYGGPRGVGWLVDDGGADRYLAIETPIIWDWAGEGSNWSGSQGFGYGVRDGFFTEGAPVFSGGLGALFDLAGDDSYQCAVMCQGFGYAWGTGLLWDRQGDDQYLVTHKYALGAATHWAVGLYVDHEGDDTYRNNDDDECIGLGYDSSVAWHLDRGDGADVYTIDNVGNFAVGGTRIPSLGVLINEGGDDEYHIPGNGRRALGYTRSESGNRAFGSYLRAVQSVGLFFDLGGPGDVYDTARSGVGNGTEWLQTEPDGSEADWDPLFDHGFGLDTE